MFIVNLGHPKENVSFPKLNRWVLDIGRYGIIFLLKCVKNFNAIPYCYGTLKYPEFFLKYISP